MIPVEIGPGAEGWLAFFFASYMIGHLVFLAGAKLDDWVYDPLAKNGTYLGQINRLKDGKGLSAPALRWTADKLFKAADERALMQVLRIKAMALARLRRPGCGQCLPVEQGAAVQVSSGRPGRGGTLRSGFEVLSQLRGRTPAARRDPDCRVSIVAGRVVRIAAVTRALALREPAKEGDPASLPVRHLARRIERNRQRQIVRAPRRRANHAGGAVYRTGNNTIEYLIIQAEKGPIRMGAAQGAHRARRGAARDRGP